MNIAYSEKASYPVKHWKWLFLAGSQRGILQQIILWKNDRVWDFGTRCYKDTSGCYVLLLQFYLFMKWSCKGLHYILCSVLNRSGKLYELPSESILSELWSETLFPDFHLTWISLLPAIFYCSWNECHIIAQEISHCRWTINVHRIAFNRIYVAILKVKGKYNLLVCFNGAQSLVHNTIDSEEPASSTFRKSCSLYLSTTLHTCVPEDSNLHRHCHEKL